MSSGDVLNTHNLYELNMISRLWVFVHSRLLGLLLR